MERIQKFLAAQGIASRRKSEELIREGKVLVNNLPARIGQKIDPDKDIVQVNGSVVKKNEGTIILALNKPRGYTTTRSDKHAKKTVYDLLPKELKNIVHPIGRLDRESEGLLLFTNNGDLTYKLTHPKFEHKKIYEVIISGKPKKFEIEKLQNGIILDGKKTAEAIIIPQYEYEDAMQYKIEIHEGRNRQIRRMFEDIGYSVKRLKRVEEAGINLKKEQIKKGKYKVVENIIV